MLLIAIGVLAVAASAYGIVDDGLSPALGAGAVLIAAAVAVALASRGGLGSRIGLPVLGMSMVGLVIQVARGHTEAHSAVFAFLAVTIVYRHRLPVVAGAATIAVPHLSFNFFHAWGWGPNCFTRPDLMLVVEPAAYVVGEAAILMMLAARSRTEFAASEQLGEIAGRLVGTDGSINFRTSPAGPAGAGRRAHAASAMVQLTDAVRESNGAAAQADPMARSASEVARRGG